MAVHLFWKATFKYNSKEYFSKGKRPEKQPHCEKPSQSKAGPEKALPILKSFSPWLPAP